ncbi:MAG: hypothetical protein ABII18_03030 [bacterium]
MNQKMKHYQRINQVLLEMAEVFLVMLEGFIENYSQGNLFLYHKI